MIIILKIFLALNKITVSAKHLINLPRLLRIILEIDVSFIDIHLRHTLPTVDVVHLKGATISKTTSDTFVSEEIQYILPHPQSSPNPATSHSVRTAMLSIISPLSSKNFIGISFAPLFLPVSVFFFCLGHMDIIPQEWSL